MIKSITFLISLLIIILTKNIFFLLIITFLILIHYLILSKFRIKKLKRLKIPLISYTIIAIINYIFNMEGMVIEIWGIWIFIDTLKNVVLLWLKLTLISISVINLTQFQSDKELLSGMSKLFSFIKIFKINPNKISLHIILMLIFFEKILQTINQHRNDKKNLRTHDKNDRQKLRFNFVERIIDIIRESLYKCEKYYNENIKDKDDLESLITNSTKPYGFIDILFLFLYIFGIISYFIIQLINYSL